MKFLLEDYVALLKKILFSSCVWNTSEGKKRTYFKKQFACGWWSFTTSGAVHYKFIVNIERGKKLIELEACLFN